MIFSRSTEAVRFAARPLVVLKYLGLMFAVFGGLILVPLMVSLFEGNHAVVWRYLAVALLAIGFGAWAGRLPVTQSIQRNEALAISALMFVLPPLLLSFPLMGYGLSFEDALFEAVSGVTTTGLSTLASVEKMPSAFLFSRAWMQWIGGLGVVVLALGLLLQPGVAASHLGFDRRETSDVVGGTRSHARKVILVYVALTAGGIVLLLISGTSIFDSVIHAMTAVSTGGYANHDDSLATLGSTFTPYAVGVLSLLGAVAFTVYYRPYYGQWHKVWRDSQAQALLAVLVCVTALVYFLGKFAPDLTWGEQAGQAFLTTISAQTTAGFSVLPVSDLGPGALVVLVVSMLLGGSLGSTAGGIKMLRLLMLVRLLQLLLLRASVSMNARIDLRLDGKRLDHLEIEASVAVVCGYLLTLLVIWMVFVSYGYEPLAALFDVTSAVATVGMSAGVVGPDLPSELKLLLCFGMIMGRVETAALIVLLFPWTWIGKRRTNR